MPRPLPEYVRGPLRTLVEARYPDRGLKGLSEAAQINYRVVVDTFNFRSANRSLHKFESFCDAIGKDMDEIADLLAEKNYGYVKALIAEMHGSVQALHRSGAVTDTYAEELYRGEKDERVDRYRRIAGSLGMRGPGSLKKLIVMMRQAGMH